jgi:hypothetical protein
LAVLCVFFAVRRFLHQNIPYSVLPFGTKAYTVTSRKVGGVGDAISKKFFKIEFATR